MKKIILSTLLMIVIAQNSYAISPKCEYINNIQNFEDIKEKDIPCAVEFIAEALNASVPTRIDKMTILTSLKSYENTLEYNYRLENLPKKINKEIAEKKMSSALKNANCTTPKVIKMINMGIKLKHTYYDEDNKFMFSVDVNKKDCENIK